MDINEQKLAEEMLSRQKQQVIFAEFGEDLIAKFKPSVLIYSYFLIGNWDIAKKVTERSFRRAHETLEQFDPKQSLLFWVMKQTTEIFFDLPPEDSGEYEDSVPNLFYQKMEAQFGILPGNIKKSLLFLRSGLKAREMATLGLYKLMDIPLADVAQLMGWAYQTVKAYSQKSQTALDQWKKKNS